VKRFGEASFEELEEHISFCLDNLRHPDCTLDEAGRFYEEAAENLRAHAILRILIDANRDGFSNDLVMSGHARRAFLRRCALQKYTDPFLSLSRSGSILDAIAGDDLALADELVRLSPTVWRRGDEYEEDFCHHRFLGLCLTRAPPAECDAVLSRFEHVAGDEDPRLAVCRALQRKNAPAFENAFQGLLRAIEAEIAEDKALASEDLTVAIGTKVSIEGIALLKLARGTGLPISLEYPMCPALTLLPRTPAAPVDEFAHKTDGAQ